MNDTNKQYIREAIAFRVKQGDEACNWYQEMVYRQFRYSDANEFLFRFAVRQYRQRK